MKSSKTLDHKIAVLESKLDYLESELSYLDFLLKAVGFPEGIKTLIKSAKELLSDKQVP